MANRIRFALLFALLAGLASAQITGDIKGIVLDSSSAAVENAAVTLKSLETGETRTATTGPEAFPGSPVSGPASRRPSRLAGGAA